MLLTKKKLSRKLRVKIALILIDNHIKQLELLKKKVKYARGKYCFYVNFD